MDIAGSGRLLLTDVPQQIIIKHAPDAFRINCKTTGRSPKVNILDIFLTIKRVQGQLLNIFSDGQMHSVIYVSVQANIMRAIAETIQLRAAVYPFRRSVLYGPFQMPVGSTSANVPFASGLKPVACLAFMVPAAAGTIDPFML